jgi:hypothetical protein
MIKFFRKIRQRLLTENKFNKYFIYAIGEIALVVIGILIALQINNWNQDQNNKQLEKNYLQNFLLDLKTDSLCIARNYVTLNTEKKGGLKLIKKLLDNPSSCCQNSIKTAIANSSFLGWAIHNVRSKATFNEIISSGNLRLISNPGLRVGIMEYYAYWDHAYERQEQRKSNYANLTYQLFELDTKDDNAEWFYGMLRQNKAELEFRKEFRHEVRYTEFLENVTLKFLTPRMNYLKEIIEMELNGDSYNIEAHQKEW